MRSEVADAHRLVLKVGSSSLTTIDGGLDASKIAELADVIAGVRARGVEVVLVSSGAIAAGLAPLGMPERPRALAEQQAAAAVGQGLLVHRYTEELARHGLVAGQVLLTVDDVTRRGHYRNAAQTLGTLLELGVVPIINENDTVATSEIPFGYNHRLAALVAHLVQAAVLVLLSDLDGLYTAPPGTPGSAFIADVRSVGELVAVEVGTAGRAGVGTGGMVTKVEAARIATDAGIPTVLAAATDAGRVLAGEVVGTLFHASGRKRSARQLWIGHATEPMGSITLDAGAVRAVRERGASLLAAGITAAAGDFHAGDPVDLLSPDGEVVARGLVNYDADELPFLFGRSTPEIEAKMGSAYTREVVHRDDLVLL